MEIKRDFLKEEWFKLDDEVSFKIGPVPFSTHKTTEVMDMVFQQYMISLLDWKGIKESGKVFKCTEDNKKFLYDYYPEIRDFVLDKAKSISSELEGEVKNS